jgi:hypothetical protein
MKPFRNGFSPPVKLISMPFLSFENSKTPYSLAKEEMKHNIRVE